MHKTPDKPAPPSQPVTLTRVRANDKTERQALFLEIYASVGNIRETAKQCDINRCTHQEWMNEEGSDYPQRFAQANDEYCDLVRETVRQRAILGVSREVFNGKGELVGTQTVYSDRLLERLAEAKCPEFKRKTEISGPNGEPVKIEVVTGVPQPDEGH